MKNDQEREDRLKEAVRDALSTVCRKDENGVFYEEIYADYRDTLDDRTLKKICNDDHPHEKFWELLDEWYCDCEWEYADNVIKQVLEDKNVAELVENPDADEIPKLIRDQFYIRYPEKHFLKEDVLIDLVIDTPTQGAEHSHDGFIIRRNAIETGVNVLTAIDTAKALITSLENREEVLTLIDIATI